MPLKCPNCKRRYADESVYCEECGESLVPAGPAWRKWAILGLGAVLVVAAVWSGLSYVESDVRENVTADLVDDGTPLPDKLPATIEQKILIQNHSMFSLRLDSLSCQAAFSTLKATCGSIVPTRFTGIPKDSSQTVTFNVTMDPPERGADPVPDAEVRVRALGIPISLPFKVARWALLEHKKITNQPIPGTQQGDASSGQGQSHFPQRR